MNKYLELINVDHLEAGQEFVALSRLLMSVGLPRYKTQLDQIKMELALKQVLATKGLTYKRLSPKKFTVAIVTL